MDATAMVYIYAIDMLLCFARIFMILHDDELAARPRIFTVLYLFLSGACIVIDAMLIHGVLSSSGNPIDHAATAPKYVLLLLYVYGQSFVIVTRLIDCVFFGARFWPDMGITIARQTAFIAIYLRRYYVLRSTRQFFMTSPRSDADGS